LGRCRRGSTPVPEKFINFIKFITFAKFAKFANFARFNEDARRSGS
jgi:hypothetical protein